MAIFAISIAIPAIVLGLYAWLISVLVILNAPEGAQIPGYLSSWHAWGLYVLFGVVAIGALAIEGAEFAGATNPENSLGNSTPTNRPLGKPPNGLKTAKATAILALWAGLLFGVADLLKIVAVGSKDSLPSESVLLLTSLFGQGFILLVVAAAVITSVCWILLAYGTFGALMRGKPWARIFWVCVSFWCILWFAPEVFVSLFNYNARSWIAGLIMVLNFAVIVFLLSSHTTAWIDSLRTPSVLEVPQPLPVRALKPDRSGLLLALSILGLLTFGPLSVISWLLCDEDLSEITRGVRHSVSKGVIDAARVIAILGSVMWGAGILVTILVARFLFVLLWQAGAA